MLKILAISQLQSWVLLYSLPFCVGQKIFVLLQSLLLQSSLKHGNVFSTHNCAVRVCGILTSAVYVPTN